MNRLLWIDLETYSEVPIQHGLHVYAARAEILLWAYALDDGPVRCWDLTLGGPMPEDLFYALRDPEVALVAHNYMFEFAVLTARGFDLPVSRWRCTMAQALQHGLPGGLDKLSAIFKLAEDEAKVVDGRRLVQLFCVPRPSNMKLRRATRDTHPEDWERFMAYCAADVTAMRVIAAKLPAWNLTPPERELFELDGRINTRGITMDRSLADAAVRTIDAEQKRLAARTAEVTDDALTSTTKVEAFRAHLAEHYDIDLPNLRAQTVEKALAGADIPEDVRELLLIRAQASLTSAAKYKVVQRALSPDGRLRITLQFCGAARTGRWAGRLFQPQNTPRPSYMGLRKAALQDAIDAGIRAIKLGVADLVVERPMEMASAAVRGLIVAPSGHRLVVADLANIEGRVLAWLAGEEWKLDAFRAYDAGAGPDLYVLAYARSFGKRLEDVTGDDRQIGKVQELALGYQGAVGAFASMAALYGVELPEEEVLKIVRAWRRANAAINRFWYAVEGAARSAILNPRTEFPVGRLVFDRVGNWLRCRLPSGRFLCYPSPHVSPETEKLSYMGTDPYTKVFKRLKTYGGKLTENATQAVARDVLAYALPRVERAGFLPVLTVHDEVITEAPDISEFDVARLTALLTEGESWTEGLPLAAAGFEAYRYRKE